MIITMTGRPCSGKSAAIAYLMKNYGFTRFSGGDIFRRIATERGIDILELNRKQDTSIDKLVDEEITRLGERDLEKDIIFDSRTAWHFIPKSFKVFLDIETNEQVRRMLNSGRTDEIIDLTEEEAKASLQERWNLENERYMMLYGVDNNNPKAYDLVVDTTNLTIEEVGEKIITAYKEFLKTRNTPEILE